MVFDEFFNPEPQMTQAEFDEWLEKQKEGRLISLYQIKELIKSAANDQDLGKLIREKYGQK